VCNGILKNQRPSLMSVRGPEKNKHYEGAVTEDAWWCQRRLMRGARSDDLCPLYGLRTWVICPSRLSNIGLAATTKSNAQILCVDTAEAPRRTASFRTPILVKDQCAGRFKDFRQGLQTVCVCGTLRHGSALFQRGVRGFLVFASSLDSCASSALLDRLPQGCDRSAGRPCDRSN